MLQIPLKIIADVGFAQFQNSTLCPPPYNSCSGRYRQMSHSEGKTWPTLPASPSSHNNDAEPTNIRILTNLSCDCGVMVIIHNTPTPEAVLAIVTFRPCQNLAKPIGLLAG